MTGCLENVTELWCVVGRRVSAREARTIDGACSCMNYNVAVVDLIAAHSINWSGSALSTFYAAIRKALVVVIVARALSILFGVAFMGWWLFGGH